MKTMPRLLLLLFCMSVVTMLFIARCGLNIDSQLQGNHDSGMPTSINQSPGEKALREVMRRKEVEHIRDKSALLEKIKTLESKLAKVQRQVVNLTSNIKPPENHPRPQAAQPWIQQHQAIPMRKTDFRDNKIFIREDKFTKMVDANDAGLLNQRFKNAFDNHNNINSNNRPPVFHGGQESFHPDGQMPPFPNDNAKIAWAGNPNIGDAGKFPNQNQFPNLHNDGVRYMAADALGNGNKVAMAGDSRVVFAGIGDRNVVDRKALGMTDEVNGKKNFAEENGEFSKHAFDPSVSRFQRSVPDPQTAAPKPKLDFDANIHLRNDAQTPKSTDTTTNTTDFSSYIKERIHSSEILKGMPYKTEYELIPFNRFVFNRIFMVDPGLGKRVVEKPIGSKKKDLSEILEHSISTLNKNRTQHLYTYDDFVEGVYRMDPATGSLYELYFYEKNAQGKKFYHSYTKLTVVRPFAPPMTLHRNPVNTANEWINIILPLSGRLDTFRIFMDQFANVCIKRDRRIYLTVVYFGSDGMKEVKHLMGKVAKAYKYKHMKLVTLNETFTRGRALQIGALNWKNGDVLLFFCDVDIVFTVEFLERCRLNTHRGQRVYYPIVFSLYNPNIVYSLQDAPMPSFQDQLVLSKDTGFWRDFGYGMTCQYRSDFLKIKGFDEQITGWGGEDVFLYQKFVRSDYFVFRVTDPAIFHLWHEKYCDPNISAEQYRSCIRSKALNEASHAQLGLLAFKDEISIHRNVSERNSLKNVMSSHENKHVNKADLEKTKL